MSAAERLAAEVRRLRRERGTSLNTLAVATSYSRQHLSTAENPRKGLPSRALISALDGALQAGGALLSLHQQAMLERQAHRAAAVALPATGNDPDEHEGEATNRRQFGAFVAAATVGALQSDPLRDSRDRLRALEASNTGAGTLDRLDVVVASFVEQYERVDPVDLVPLVHQEQRWVGELLDGRQHPRERARLYLTAGQLAGLMGNIAFDLGDYPAARLHCVEAVTLADHLGHGQLRAWVRSIQALTEYYAGQYHRALEFARDGQRHAGDSPVAARLASQAEARTLACLGDVRGVQEAVDRAHRVMDGLTADQHGAPGLSIDTFHPAELACYVTTAYATLGLAEHVEEHARQAVAALPPAAESPGLHSLVLIDQAAVALAQHAPDPERASHFAQRAVAVSVARPVDWLGQRVRALAATARHRADVPTAGELQELAATYPMC